MNPISLWQGKKVPVLTYHSVSDIPVNASCAVYSVRPAELEEQIRFLLEQGFTPITFADVLERDVVEKPIMLTFDDGYADNYVNLFPLLKQYQVKAVLSVNCSSIGAEGFLTAAQIKEMHDSGLVSIQSHTMSHTSLDGLDAAQMEYELAQSQRQLAELTGEAPTAICYPMASYNPEVLRRAKMYYAFGLVGDGGRRCPGCWRIGRNDDTIPRCFVWRGIKIKKFRKLISRAMIRQ